MNHLTFDVVLYLTCVGIFTLAAAITDVRTRRIPNKLTLPVFFLGLVYQAAFHGWTGLGDAGLAFLIGFGTLFVLWLIGGGGGGDVKLMGALSVWLGWKLTLIVLVLSTAFVLIASVFAIVYGALCDGTFKTKRRLFSDRSQIARENRRSEDRIRALQKRRVMAFALPVALATWLVVFVDVMQMMAGPVAK